MTDTSNAPRKNFRPILRATITPASIEHLVASGPKQTPYIKMSGATVTRGDKTNVRTVMAFGKSADAVRDMLVEGQPVELAVQYDGGTVKIIGEVREPQAAEG